jgi:NADP-dependent 3-hydroxy acid dehydrogenase YdfG
LRQELAPEYNINVTSLEPGFVDTELTDTITDEEIKEKMGKMADQIDPLKAEDIAEAIYYAINQPKRSNINDVYIMPTSQKQ